MAVTVAVAVAAVVAVAVAVAVAVVVVVVVVVAVAVAVAVAAALGVLGVAEFEAFGDEFAALVVVSVVVVPPKNLCGVGGAAFWSALIWCVSCWQFGGWCCCVDGCGGAWVCGGAEVVWFREGACGAHVHIPSTSVHFRMLSSFVPAMVGRRTLAIIGKSFRGAGIDGITMSWSSWS